MPSIVINDFSAGWTPGDDPIKGRRNGLLRMDNLELDSNGALTLAGGASVKQSGFPAAAHTLYSRSVNGTRHDYSLLANGAGYRDNTSLWASGGDTSHGAFGTAFDFTLIFSGNKRFKDNGSALVNFGVVAPTAAPTFDTRTAVYTSALPLGSATFTPAAYSSSFATPYLTLGTTPTDVGISVVQSNGIGGAPFNWLLMSDGSAGIDDDYLEVFPVFNPTNLIGFQAEQLQIDIMLDSPSAPGVQVSNYYTYTIQSDGTGVNDWRRIRRADFNKVGPGLKDWSTVYGFRITYISATGFSNSLNVAGVADSLKFKGGVHAQNGTYTYYQMNVNNTGSYLAKSELSAPTATQIQLSNETAHIFYQNPSAVDTQVNEVWIFRQGGLLDKPYRVKVIPSASWSGSSIADPLSDAEALELNIWFDFNLRSWQNIATINDNLFDIVGPVNGRWYYFTQAFMYPSDLNDPDLFNVSLGVRTCGNSSELFMWARQVSAETILVGTSMNVYALSGTFASFPDGSVDIFYRPLHCQYPPLTCDAVAWGGSVYYLANDGWRLISPGGENPSLVSPNLDRLYKGEDVSGYPHPNLKIVPRSARFPIVIAKNKIWCFITGVSSPRVEVYDFIRQYWRAVTYYVYSDFSAATATQDGQVLVFFGADHKLREIDIQTSKLLDGTFKQAPVLLPMIFDGGYPRQRKDSSTLKIRYSSTDPINAVVTTENSALVAVGPYPAHAPVTDVAFDISQLATLEIGKTYQVRLGAGAVIGNLTIEDMEITYDLRPEQRTFIRVQSNNYGTTARKRLSTIPFQLDSLGHDVIVTSILDGVTNRADTFNANRKASFNLEFVGGATLPIAKDYEYTIYSPNLFEFFGFEEPRIVEIYPQQALSITLPVTNFGNANKKRIRVRPFVLSAPSPVSIIHTPLVDGVATASSIFSVGTEKKTYFHFFKTDVFGVDYGGYFTASSEFEVGEILPPEIVQILPIAKQFDQVGPEEFFRYGKIKMIELRVLAYGTSIPFTIYFNDNTNYTGTFTTVNGKESTYFIMLPKGTSGNIVRVELGPTNFDFHRFYTRLQVTRSGKDTELEWINL